MEKIVQQYPDYHQYSYNVFVNHELYNWAAGKKPRLVKDDRSRPLASPQQIQMLKSEMILRQKN